MATNVADSIVNCPQCGCPIKLTESLAAPLIEATRKAYEEKLAAKDKEVAQRETALGQREALC